MGPDTERAFGEELIARGIVDRERLRGLLGQRARGGRAPSLARLACRAGLLDTRQARAVLSVVRRASATASMPSSSADATPLGIRFDSASSSSAGGSAESSMTAPESSMAAPGSSSGSLFASGPGSLPGLPRVAAKPGRKVGPYEIVSELGRGGMGVVYHAVDTRLGREVALKTMMGRLDERRLERFRREGRAVARLRHPGIVQVFETDEHAGVRFIAFEFVAGGSLQQRLALDGPLLPRAAAALVRDAARAIAAAHREGIVHRDLKPANVLLEKDGRPRVADFGLVRDELEREITSTGEVLGTLEYMAPEQVLGRISDIGPVTDVYGLGALLYAALTGKPPCRAPTSAEVMRRVVHVEPERPTARRRELGLGPVPDDLEAIAARALAKARDARYPSADELADDLDRFLLGAQVRAVPRSPLRRLRAFVRREAWTLAALLVAGGLAGLGGAAWGLRFHGPSRAAVGPAIYTVDAPAAVGAHEDRATVTVVASAPLASLAANGIEQVRGEPQPGPWTIVVELSRPDGVVRFTARDAAGRPAVGPREVRVGRREATGNLPANLERGANLYLWRTGRGFELELVHVPPGDFQSGTVPGDDGDTAERPWARRTLARGFWIARNLTTWGEYLAFCRATGRSEPRRPDFWDRLGAARDGHPVTNVTFDDARAFAEWVGLSIPTEDEWEKAAGGPEGRRYPWGNTWDARACNSNAPASADGFDFSAPVGSFSRGASPYGMLDAVGNASSWCEDSSSSDDPFGGTVRPVRGGNFELDAQGCRIAFRRVHTLLKGPHRSIGIRLVKRGI